MSSTTITGSKRPREAAAESSESSELPDTPFKMPPRIKIDAIDLETDTQVQEAEEDPAKIRFALFMKKKMAAAPKKYIEIPTVFEMAAELGIDWVGAVDPGRVNGSIAIYSLKEARLVYWRVFPLTELCESCEISTGESLRKNDVVGYSDEASLRALSWWCQQPESPIKRCDLVVIENQSFSREMTEIQGIWVASLVNHKPAVTIADCPLSGGKETYTMVVPKVLVVSAHAVKGAFKGLFPLVDAPMSGAAAATAAASGQSEKEQVATKSRSRKGAVAPAKPRYPKVAFGVGDAKGNLQQYEQNKSNAKYWCRYMLGDKLNQNTGLRLHRNDDVMTESAADDFETAALEVHHTMTVEQVAKTAERLAGAKSDDLSDSFFIVFYAVDFAVPYIWHRARGPTATRNTNRYVYGDIPSINAPSLQSTTAEERHQALFTYLKQRVKLPADRIAEIADKLK